MKGQASIEYLILGLLALSMLALSLTALASIRDSAIKGIAVTEAGGSASMLMNAMREACALGTGNGREVRIGGSVLVVNSEKADAGWIVRISMESNPEALIVRQCPCQAEGSEGLSGTVFVKNEGGKIRITRR